MRGHDIVGRAQDKAVGFQLLQGLRQHPFANAPHLAAQFGKPVSPRQQNDQRQGSPSTGQMRKDSPRGAIGGQDIAALQVIDKTLCKFAIRHVRCRRILTILCVLTFRKLFCNLCQPHQKKETTMTKIAITGATGQLGRLAIAALKATGHSVVALTRSPEKATDLGVEVRAFDYTQIAPGALSDVGTLVLISSNDFNDRAGQHRNVIAAAKAAGVGRVIYTSILKGDASPMLLAADHIATEAALKDSGLAFTLLRNGWYTENYTGSLAAALQYGAMIGSAGEGLISSASRADYAQAIAVTAAGQDHAGKVYELAGDTAYRLADLAAEVSAQSGKAVHYNNLPQADYAGALVGFGLPEGFAHVLADSDAKAAGGALFDDSRTLSRLIGRPTTPMAKTVKEALAAL